MDVLQEVSRLLGVKVRSRDEAILEITRKITASKKKTKSSKEREAT